MSYVLTTMVGFILAVLSQFTVTLDRCFLQNNSALLPALISLDSPTLITLPEPIQISDCFSPAQSLLLLTSVLNRTSTVEFILDPANQIVADRRGIIIQARWSFVDKATGRKYLFWLYFYLIPDNHQSRNQPTRFIIKEIRAERR
ncbi:MAG TPA: hypothetical protein PLB50_03955 [Candidatus Saccharicenans sp.]|nr:hypothetical protein [Candidatus Saccharicenans sp.]HNS05417.1 hypothetical protein [Candidatus Saccharicenans sp.]HNT00709.1 hypothetical protein [Candidatus Saccharicenans sp.]HPB59247.1 hypothetical protein [Candidatus Saccharicenans sp.]HQO75815.1 hypothetical protein [Candidatus Saccharicenans sp.]